MFLNRFFLFSEIHSSVTERLTSMTDQEHIFNVGKVVLDDNSQERKSCFGQASCRSLIFLSQHSVKLLHNFGCCWSIQLLKTYEESAVEVRISSSSHLYISPSQRLGTN